MVRTAEQVLDAMIEAAQEQGASDIHIDPLNEGGMVRARVDGELQLLERLTNEELLGTVSRIKLLSRMDISERRLPQDGAFQWRGPQHKCDLRVSTVPTLHGEKLVMRIHKPQQDLQSIHQLGIDAYHYPTFMRLLSIRNGFVILSGSIGSGKTTTLYAVVRHLAQSGLHVLSVEDPVEAQVEGVSQMQVNPKIGLTFAEGVRSVLRQDPNVLVIGEIRDRETAEMAVRASMTGHLVLATVHSGDSVQSLLRLMDMGIPPESIASSVKGVVHQRLVRRLCSHCKKETRLLSPAPVQERYKEPPLARGFSPVGCERCGNSGYSGRLAVFEVLDLGSETARNKLLSQSPWEWTRALKGEGFHGIDWSMRDRVREGVVSYGEYRRWFYADPETESEMV